MPTLMQGSVSVVLTNTVDYDLTGATVTVNFGLGSDTWAGTGTVSITAAGAGASTFTYTTEAEDLERYGELALQAKIVNGSGTFYTSLGEFTVNPSFGV